MIKVITNKNFIKIIYIFCFITLSFALFITSQYPALGWEYSIYSYTPLIFWVSIIFSILVGIITLFSQIYIGNLNNKNIIYGIILITLCFFLCLSLYITRNYYLWNVTGDFSTHINYIKIILLDGHIPDSLFYPLTHIFGAELAQILNVPIKLYDKYLPLFFSMLSILFIYVFAKSVLNNKKMIVIATILGCAFLSGWYLNFSPNQLANAIFPIFLFIMFKSIDNKNAQWTILLILMIIFFPPLHPLPALAALSVLVVIFFLDKLSKIVKNRRMHFSFSRKISLPPTSFKSNISLTLIVLLIVVIVSWISSFYFIWEKVLGNILLLTKESGPTQISVLTTNLNYAQSYGFNLIEQILKLEFGFLVYLGFVFVSVPLIIRNIKLKLFKENLNKFLYLYGIMIGFTVLIVILYFSKFDFGPLRLQVYIIYLSLIFGGFVIHELLIQKKKLTSLFVTILVLIVFVNSVFTLYPSPYINQISYQNTGGEVQGMSWFFSHRNIDIPTSGMTISLGRFGDLLLPANSPRNGLTYIYSDDLKVPYHFNYDKNSSLSSFYLTNVYIIIVNRDKKIYKNVFPSLKSDRWYSSDFEKIDNNDKSINKIYSDYELNVYSSIK